LQSVCNVCDITELVVPENGCNPQQIV